ncbi:MAG: UDP-glucose--hexose-1-phosphate uridylyltransferase [Pseudomonadota bacterium]
MSYLEKTHRRKNILTGEWVLVSPHRNQRPWSGATERVDEATLPVFDANCPLCPGNTRANGVKNPTYQSTYTFVNDFGALTSHSPDDTSDHVSSELFISEPATGECRVICFSPDHNRTLPELSTSEILAVVDCWQDNFVDLSTKYNCVHIFENKGAVMGCSQPHPHGQIWAHDHLSTEIEKKLSRFTEYYAKHTSCLLDDYVNAEISASARIVIENEDWVVVTPYWAIWPFETMLVCRHPIAHFGNLDERMKTSLAKIIQQLTIKYDNVFECSFPYSMGWHNSPLQKDHAPRQLDNAPRQLENEEIWRLHAHYYPPLLRSATVKKFMVGYEMLAESQRDLTVETAAQILRDCSNVHYKKAGI